MNGPRTRATNRRSVPRASRGSCRARMRPAPAAEVTFTKSRRLTLITFMSHLLRRAMDRSSDALVRSAATEIAVHGLVDVGVGGLLLFHEQPGRGHDLPG